MTEPNKQNMIAGLFTAYAFETITVSNAVKTLTASKYGDSVKRAVITIQNAQLRYNYNGSTPTATVGHAVNPFDVIVLIGTSNIQNFKAIRKGTTDSVISVTYEK